MATLGSQVAKSGRHVLITDLAEVAPKIANEQALFFGWLDSQSSHLGMARKLDMMTGATRKAGEWLKGQLADGQPHPAGELLAKAKAAGIAPRTLQEARRRIGATTTKHYAKNGAGIQKLRVHLWQLEPGCSP